MRRGDFEAAWEISDRRLTDRLAHDEPQHSIPRHFQSIWDGRALAGKHVLVRCYHGLGDTIQFIRFARRLRSIAREVSVWCQTDLMALVATVPGVDRVLPLHDGAPPLAYDADVEVMELPHILRITRADLPSPVPYIKAVRGVAPLKRDGMKVGLIWASGDWEPLRSMHFSDLAPLFQVRDVGFYSLQLGRARAEIAAERVLDVASNSANALAATLRQLDLLISVDTFGAHLAGALGLPVWLLLHRPCDWRWADHGTHSVWYPTMRLFRQQYEGDWRHPILQVADGLEIKSRLTSVAHNPQEQTHCYDVRPLNELTFK